MGIIEILKVIVGAVALTAVLWFLFWNDDRDDRKRGLK